MMSGWPWVSVAFPLPFQRRRDSRAERPTHDLPPWTPDHVRGDDADNGYADTAPPQDEMCVGGENMDT